MASRPELLAVVQIVTLRSCRLSVPTATRLSATLLVAILGGGSATLTAARHVVQPKATTDHGDFTAQRLMLPDGAQLAYYVRSGSGPTLMLVPETHGDRTQFQEPSFLANLDPNLRIVIVESRGQGRSWPPPTAAQASIERYASDVLAVVRELKLAHWYVGGHSLGGMIALEIGGQKPNGLQGVISLEGWVRHSVQAAAFPETNPPSETERAEMRRQRDERHRTQGWNTEHIAALQQIWRVWEGGEQAVRRSGVPILSVWGDRGLKSRPTASQLRLPENERVQIRWIAGADHYVTDAPFSAQTAQEITRFIAAVEQVATASGPRAAKHRPAGK